MNKPQLMLVDNQLGILDCEWYDRRMPMPLNSLQNNDLFHVDDPIVREMIDVLCEDERIEGLFGTSYPSDLRSIIDRNVVFPSIVIFDWEYDDRNENEIRLSTIDFLLKKTPAIVLIYTDRIDEATQSIQYSELQDYIDQRLLVKLKDSTQIKNAIDGLFSKHDESFMYLLSINAYRSAIESLRTTCALLTRFDQTQLSIAFCEHAKQVGTNKWSTKIDDHTLYNIIIESLVADMESQENIEREIIIKKETIKLKGGMIKIKYNGVIENVLRSKVRQLWGIKLYSNNVVPSRRVRKGDIIKYQNRVFMVSSGDCDLGRFFDKTQGFVSLLPIKRCSDLEGFVSDKVNELSGDIKSIGEGYKKRLYIIPSWDPNDAINYVVLASIESILIPKKNGIENTSPLKYSDYNDIKFLTHMKLPYSTALIDNMRSIVTGYGTQDCNHLAKNFLFRLNG